MHWLDYAIILIPFMVVIAVSWSTRRYVKSVADFMSAGRCAGRYLICTASGEAAFGAIGVIAGFEYLYKAGFAIGWWGQLAVPVSLFVTLTGYVIYRYRQTRAMTLAQFFEIRYSRGFRVFAGIMAFTSGLLYYGVFPAIVGRFFVNYCGFPQTVAVLGQAVPTFILVMLFFLSFALMLTLMGGQLTIMVGSTLEGILSGIFYILAAVTVIGMFRWTNIVEAMSHAPKGESMLNPFDTIGATDFNIWFVLIGLLGIVYGPLAWQGGHAFRSSAASAHEAKMASVLGSWRVVMFNVMITLLAVCAFTYMNHADYASGAALVNARLQTIDGAQLQTQMRVPVALSHLLPIGIKGVFAAIMFFAAIACDGSYMHSWGSIFIQDVIVPFRKTPFTPEQHIRLLRWAMAGVAAFAFAFSALFAQTEYILMYLSLIAGVFVAGAGCAVIGGLYWNKGTAQAAWAGMITGSVFALGGFGVQQAWPRLNPALCRALGWLQHLGSDLSGVQGAQDYLRLHADKFPVNGVVINFYAMLTASLVYIAVSLLTCKTNFNMDRMLHRGLYAVEGDAAVNIKRRWTWGSLIGIDSEFTRGDKIIAGGLFGWSMFWFVAFVVMTVWYILRPWPQQVWSSYWHLTVIILPLLVGTVTTLWLTWGGVRDLLRLFKALPNVRRSALDDGSVAESQNRDEVNSVGY